MGNFLTEFVLDNDGYSVRLLHSSDFAKSMGVFFVFVLLVFKKSLYWLYINDGNSNIRGLY